jgi:hypothetical protein
MSGFAEDLDFTGKTVLPVVTYAVSGMGGAPDDYTDACPSAAVGDGLAVRGEEVADAGDTSHRGCDVSTWDDHGGLAAPVFSLVDAVGARRRRRSSGGRPVR